MDNMCWLHFPIKYIKFCGSMKTHAAQNCYVFFYKETFTRGSFQLGCSSASFDSFGDRNRKYMQ